MKTLMTLAMAWALLLTQGCTRNDRDSAGLQREPGVPPTQAQPEPSSPGEVYQTDPAANGGLGLPAAVPYGGGSSISQNVNPGPFMTAAQAQGVQAAAPGALPPTGMLTRSADGTMSGSRDLPPATTGWGTAATNYQSPAAPTKRSAAAGKSTATPK